MFRDICKFKSDKTRKYGQIGQQGKLYFPQNSMDRWKGGSLKNEGIGGGIKWCLNFQFIKISEYPSKYPPLDSEYIPSLY